MGHMNNPLIREVESGINYVSATVYNFPPVQLPGSYKERIIIRTVRLVLSSIVTAATVTIKLTSDSNGNDPITPELTGGVIPGEFTSSVGSVVIDDLNVGLFLDPSRADGPYFFAKTDAGSCRVDDVEFLYQE